MSSSQDRLSCFKAYDVRGQVPDELDADLVYRIGRAYAGFVKPRRVAVGHDIRLTGPELSAALVRGLVDAGVDVVDVGRCGTEGVYFATFHLGLDGGIMVTASHNPADHNGLKLVREGARPISSDTGLAEIEAAVLAGRFPAADRRGSVQTFDLLPPYLEHLMGYVDRRKLDGMTVVTNAGNGGAGPYIDRLERHLPVRFVKLQHEPDGRFPNGVPNPLLPDKRQVTSDAVRAHAAQAGIAWDGDFDRCFLFDENGAFIEGYYIVGLLAARVLKRHPGSRIVHDPRLTWNTIEIVRAAGGVPVQSKSGHAFMKEVLRREDAAYGGEMSAHHFFREFSFCDSGMIPWLLVLEMMGETGKPLSELVGERMRRYPASGEINRRVDDASRAIARVRAAFETGALRVDETDGVGIEFDRWRFNLRRSNTEPLVRLNVESRGDADLMRARTEDVLALLG
jgi:phosphomannomutase/phosphomannomutase/phosphoglucomutase